MRWTRFAVILIGLAAPFASATHDPVCVPTSADPSTYLSFSVGGRLFYVYEENLEVSLPVLVPLSGMVFGDGTNVYEESNGLLGLQRESFCGTMGLGVGGARPHFCMLDVIPGCDQNPDWEPTDGTVPCFTSGADLIDDETCHAGPDTKIL